MTDVYRSSYNVGVEPEDDFPIVSIFDVVTSDASLDPFAGGTANNKPIWTPEQIASYLNRTSGQWGDGFNDLMTRSGDETVITYGFHENRQSLLDNGYMYTLDSVTYYAFSEYFNFATFTEAQRAATREAMQNWDDVVAVSFVETSAYDGDINFGNLASAPATQAYSRIPTEGYGTNFGGAYGTELSIAGYAGDIWVSASQASNFQFDEGLYGLNTLVHEIGHSLGLSHPGAYNFGPGFAVTYANGAEYAQDARNYSIMSYWNPRDLGGTATGVVTRDFDWSLMSIAYGSTPMVHDILAAQLMYGVDTTTRTGDTTYGFNSNAGRDHYDFTMTPWPTMAIWDADGNDTLDASGFNANQRIDLTPGSLSSIGGLTYDEAMASLSFAQVNANRAAAGYAPVSLATYNANMAVLASQPDRARLTDNVGIAYGAIIENAVGGGGNDTILGNAVGNLLIGNAGNDVIEGRGGNDTLNGGIGDDTMSGGVGNDLYFVDANGDGVTELADEGHDTVSSGISYTLGANVEDLVLTGSAANGTGNELDNLITGNALGNRLNGAAGNDRLVGGNGVDFLTGGAGNDTFLGEINATKTASKSGPISLDVITDFQAGDLIDLAAIDAKLGVFNAGDQAFTFKGTNANKSAGDLTFKVYDSVNGAENALGFDIDGIAGPSTYSGPVTIVFGNVDGGAPDFAIALLNTNGVSFSDFLL